MSSAFARSSRSPRSRSSCPPASRVPWRRRSRCCSRRRSSAPASARGLARTSKSASPGGACSSRSRPRCAARSGQGADRSPAMYESEPDTIWWNGRLVPWDQARVHVTSEVATRGTNVFEGVRAYWQAEAGHSALLHPGRHFARLAQSARLVRFPADQVATHIAQMRAGIGELVEATGGERDLYLRPTLYIERGRYGWRSEDTELGSYIAAYPVDQGTDRPLSCIVSSWRRTKDLAISPLAKAGAAYQAFRLPRIEAAIAGADEAILLNDADTVAETGGAAVFIVRGGVV